MPDYRTIQNIQNSVATESVPTNITNFAPSLTTSEIDSQGRYPVFFAGLNNEDIYGQNQSSLNKWKNAAGKFAATTASTFTTGTAGLINGVYQWAKDGQFSSFYDNEFNNTLDNWTKGLENSLPNYYTDAEKNAAWYSPKTWGTANFWSDTIFKNSGFALGAFLSGGAWSKAFGLVGKVAKGITAGGASELAAAAEETSLLGSNFNALNTNLSRVASNFASRQKLLDFGSNATRAGMATFGEASIEALNANENYKNELIRQYQDKNGIIPEGEDLAKIEGLANDIGNITFGANMALLSVTNYIQYPKLLGTFWKGARGEVTAAQRGLGEIATEGDNVLTRTLTAVQPSRTGRILNKVKNFSRLFFSPSEAFEEGAQSVIPISAQDWVEKGQTGDQDIIETLGKGIKDTLNSKEGMLSILSGGITGGIIERVGGIRQGEFLGGFSRDRRIRQNTNQFIQAANNALVGSYLKEGMASINRAEVLNQELNQAALSNDRLAYEDAKTDQTLNYLLPRIQYGRFDLVQDDLQGIKNLAQTQDGWNELIQNGLATNEMEQNDFLANLSQLENLAKTTNDQYQALERRYGTQRNENGTLKYTNDVLLKMAYTGAKIDDYNKRITSLLPTINAAGIDILTYTNSIGNDTLTEDDIQNLDSQIENKQDLSPEAKDQLREIVSDILELSARRKFNVDQYQQLRDFPSENSTPQNPLINPLDENEGLQVDEEGNPLTDENGEFIPIPTEQLSAKQEFAQSNPELGLEYNPETDTLTLNGREITNDDLRNQEGLIDPQGYLTQVDPRTPFVLRDRFQEELQELAQRRSENQERINQLSQDINQIQQDLNVENWTAEELVTKKKGWFPQFVSNIDTLTQLRDEAQSEIDNLQTENQRLDNQIQQLQDLISNPPQTLQSSIDLLQEQQSDLENLVIENGNLINSLSGIVDSTRALISRLGNIIKDKLQSFQQRNPNIPVIQTAINALDQNSPELTNILTQVQQLQDFEIAPAKIRENQTIGQIQDLYKQIQDYNNQIEAKQAILDRLQDNQKEIDTRQELAQTTTPEQIETIQENQAQEEITQEPEPTQFYPEEGERKPIDKIFRSGILLEDSQKNTPWYQRNENFLNKHRLFPQKDNFRVVLVTANNEQELGLSGIVDYAYKTNQGNNYYKNEESKIDPIDGAILAVVIEVDPETGNKYYLDQNGTRINEVGEQTDLNQILLSKMPAAKLTFRNGQQNYADRKGINPQEVLDSYIQERQSILNSTTPRESKFTISRGRPITNKERNPIVGTLIPKEAINDKGILKVIHSDGKLQDAQGNSYNVRKGTVIVQYEDIREQANTRQLTQSESDLVFDLLKLVRDNEKVSKYLQGLFYTQFSPDLATIRIKDKTFTLDADSLDENEEEIKTLLQATFTNANDTLLQENEPFEEIINGNLETVNWQSYQAFLLSPTYDTEESRSPSLTTSVREVTGNNLSDSNFIDKYIVLDNLAAEQPRIELPEVVLLQQDREVNLPTPPQKTLNWIDSFLGQIGVTVESIKEIVVNNQKLNANGAALPLQGLVLYVDGQTNALTEETMHLAVELVSQKNTQLFQEMMDKITSLPIYKQVFEAYKNEPLYQKNGRPDITKIKKEAIGKQLTQTIINQQSQSFVQRWWNKVIDFFKELFGNAAQDMKVFQEAVSTILTEDLGTIRDTLLKSEDYLGEQGLTPEQIEEVINLANSNITTDELRTAIGNLVPQMVYEQVAPPQTDKEFSKIKEFQKRVTKEDNKTFIDGKEITKSTTSSLKRSLNNTPEHRALLNSLENRENSKTYKATQDILRRHIDPNGFVRENPLPYQGSELTKTAYEALEDNIVDRLKTFESDTKFLSGVTLYANNTQGSIDFIALTPDGRTHALMFQEISIPEGENIPGYEAKAYRTFMDSTRDLMRNFGITKFGMTRVIPVNKIEDESNMEVIQIGETTYNNEDNDYLTPIPATKESTGNEELDRYIKRLNDLASQIVSSPAKEEQRVLKNKQLAQLYKGIRELQLNKNLRPLIRQSKSVTTKLEELVNRYTSEFKGKNVSKKTVGTFTDEMMLMSQIADTFSDLDTIYDEAISDSPQGLGLKTQVAKASSEVKVAKNNLNKVLKSFVDEHITTKLGISDILKPERVVKFLSRNFRSLSQTSTAATQALYKLTFPITQRVDIEQNQEIKRLARLKEEYEKLAKSKGLALKDYLSLITKKDSKKRYIHELVDKYEPEFYQQLRKAQEENNLEWAKENLDLEEYNKWFENQKQQTFDNIDETTYDNDEAENEKIREEQKEKFLDKYDISRNVNIFNPELKFYPKTKWYNSEYQELLKPENKAALDLYNYIQEKNNEAVDLGVMENWRARNFIPQIRKDLVEKVTFGGITSGRIGESFYRSISVNQEDFEYGKVDPITGELKDEIPFYFLQDLSRDVIDETGEEYKDFSGISTNIFTVLEAYNKQILKYRYLSEIESQVQAIGQIEKNKKALATDRFGNRIEDGEEIENVDNYKYFQNFVKAKLYGQRNVANEWDANLGKVTNKIGKAINKVSGKEIFSTDYSGNNISLSRTIDAANRFFSLKVLGLNIPVSISNLMGTNFNAWIEAGKYFTKGDFREMEFGIMMGKMSNQKDKNQVLAMDYFIPFVEGENNQGQARQLSFSNLNKFSFPELLMSIQRVSDRPVQWGIAGALLKNTMVENGEFVNIREYLRNTPEYQNIYNLPESQRKELQTSFEEKVKELQNTRSVLAIGKKNENDEFEIPGIERNSEAVYKFRELIQQLTRNATGMGNQDDIRQINLSLIGRSMMLFKNWVSRLADRRFSELRYVPATDEYEWGRMKVMANLLGKGILSSAKNLQNVLNLNDAGVSFLKEEYEQRRIKYEAETGKEFKMSERDFIEMYQRSIKGQLQELAVFTTLMSIFFALKSQAPDDDEDVRTKGFYKWGLRAFDKITNELGFFYNPAEWVKMSNGQMFPAATVVTDLVNVTKHSLKEGFGYITNNEELVESAKPAKYMMKTFPILKSITPYMAIFMAETSQNEWGLKSELELPK